MNDQQAPTDDDIARMAREAGLQLAVSVEAYPVITGQLRRFAGLVAAAEREACARILDENSTHCTSGSPMNIVLRSNAAAIRARGEA